MNLDLIIAQLRFQTPLFEQRVGGSAKFEVLAEAANMRVPAAYVLPLNEQPEEQNSQTGYRQTVREGFAVVVVLSNRADERGQTAATNLDVVRKQLFSALLGFQPAEEMDVITFQGGELLHMDRARLYYQFEFEVPYYLDEADSWISLRDAALPDFESLQLKLDALDVFDPNMPETDFPDDPTAYPGGKGPDGRAEGGLNLTLPTS